jgi:hypothetical protein
MLPEIMDRALAGAACPFKTHAESVRAFARAIYALRLEGGRCIAPGTPVGCGLYDPYNLYYAPPVGTVAYAGEAITFAATDQAQPGGVKSRNAVVVGGASRGATAVQPYPVGIRSSFGMDFVDVILDSAVDGQALRIELHGAEGATAEFDVQLLKMIDPGGDARPRCPAGQTSAPETLMQVDADGSLSYVIPAVDTGAYNRLGLIITRVDDKESVDPVGAYTIVLRPLATPS